MKILQKEIDVVPETNPTVQNAGPGVRKAGGVAVLELDNDSPAINTFRVWVKDEADSEVARQAGYSRLDQPGPGEVPDKREDGKYIAQASSRVKRRIAVTFKAPKDPAVKSGVYDASIEVEADEPVGQGPQSTRRASFPIKIVVRPFIDWSITAKTKKQVFGLFRRRRTYMLVVENRGNDWLYVDLSANSELPNLKTELDTQRIAVPPAASADHPSRRNIPLKVWFKGKGWVGAIAETDLPIAALRIDAPSVSRFPDVDGSATVQTLNLGQPVLLEKTTQSLNAAGIKVAYRPPIPRTVPDLISAIRQNATALLGLFLMGVLAFYGIAMLWSSYHNKVRLEFTTADGHPIEDAKLSRIEDFKVSGDDLAGSDIKLTNDKGEDISADFNLVNNAKMTNELKDEFHVVLKNSSDEEFWLVKPLASAAGLKSIKISVQRKVFHLVRVPALMWSPEEELKIGSSAFTLLTPPDSYVPGQHMKLAYSGDARNAVISIGPNALNVKFSHQGDRTFLEFDIPAAMRGVHQLLVQPDPQSPAVPYPLIPTADSSAPSTAGAAPGSSAGAQPTSAGAPAGTTGSPSGGTPDGQGQSASTGAAAGGFTPPPGYQELDAALKGTPSGSNIRAARGKITGQGVADYALLAICDALLDSSDKLQQDLIQMSSGVASDAYTRALVDAAMAGGEFVQNDPQSTQKKLSDILSDLKGQQGCDLPYWFGAWVTSKLGQDPAAWRKLANGQGG